MINQNNIPKNLAELRTKCQLLSNKSVLEVAKDLNITIPQDLKHQKGFIGQLIEIALGISINSKATVDLVNLGVEIKTIPVNNKYIPTETTYVCTVESNNMSAEFVDSWVYNKIKKVLYVPVVESNSIGKRIILPPILHSLGGELYDALKCDYEELMDMYCTGMHKNLSSRYGEYLHIRPKALNSNKWITKANQDGDKSLIVPKGFYLRKEFTKIVLKQPKFTQ